MAYKVICGVYRIQSKVHKDRLYIGSSVNIKDRWRQHRMYLRNNDHHSLKLQRHYNKYGLDDLCFSIIEEFQFTTKEFLLSREQFYLDSLHPFYNNSPTASSTLGVKMVFTEEHKKKISESLKGRKKSKEHVANLTGKKRSAETRLKLSESRRKLDISGANNPRYGKKLSDETKKKISDKAKGRTAWNKGIKRSEADIAAIKEGIKKKMPFRKKRIGAFAGKTKKNCKALLDRSEKLKNDFVIIRDEKGRIVRTVRK